MSQIKLFEPIYKLIDSKENVYFVELYANKDISYFNDIFVFFKNIEKDEISIEDLKNLK